jgi:hypothetical protein
MGKIHVYLPDELEARMRAAELSPSELLQAAVDQELGLQAKRESMARFFAEGDAQYGPPTADDQVWAEERLASHRERFGGTEGRNTRAAS